MTDAPRPTEIDPRNLSSFSEAARLVDRLEEIMRRLIGTQVASGSDLESVCLDVLELENYRTRRSQLDPMTDIRPILGQAAGWLEFLRILVRVYEMGRLDETLHAHLRLLNTAREVAQNTRLPVSDEASNKLFELFIALCCVPISGRVTIDDPYNAQGGNPDVLIEFGGR